MAEGWPPVFLGVGQVGSHHGYTQAYGIEAGTLAEGELELIKAPTQLTARTEGSSGSPLIHEGD
jgi:hypothetical protein